MGFKVKVKFGGIDDLARRLDAMPNAIQRAGVMAGRETISLIEESFSSETAPDGAPWAPRVRNGGHPILTKTARLRGSFRLIPLRRGFIVRTRVQYSSFHMSGTSRMVARPFMPKRGRLPAKWRRRLTRVIIRELMKGIRN